jgi:hypothetical protein
MSLAKTLMKVAIGVAVAKGVSALAKGGLGGTAAAAPGRGTPYGGQKKSGLESIFENAIGGGQPSSQSGGTGSGGGLGDLLGQLTGASRDAPPRTTPRRNAPAGGLEDLLGGLLGGRSSNQSQGSAGGGAGDLLDSVMGGRSSGQTSSGASAGGMAPGGGGGLGDLLGAILGGAGGAAAGGALANTAENAGSSRNDDLAAALILRAMVQAVKSDGDLDEAEKRKLMENMGEASQEEIAFVNAELSREVEVEGLARQVPEGMEAQIYLMSLMAINLDSGNEAQYLHNLATALEMGADEVNALHDKAGAKRIYR